MDAWLM